MLILIFILDIFFIIFSIGWVFYMISLTPRAGSIAPFVPVRRHMLDVVPKYLGLKPDSVVYDLGSGDGRMLFACFRLEPEAKYIGIDKNFFPYWWARILRLRLPKEAFIEFKREDFFNTDLSQATHLYTYLFPQVMDALLPKLEQELRPGTKLISCDFQFANKKPIQVIDLPVPQNKTGRQIFVYEF